MAIIRTFHPGQLLCEVCLNGLGGFCVLTDRRDAVCSCMQVLSCLVIIILVSTSPNVHWDSHMPNACTGFLAMGLHLLEHMQYVCCSKYSPISKTVHPFGIWLSNGVWGLVSTKLTMRACEGMCTQLYSAKHVRAPTVGSTAVKCKHQGLA